VFGQDTLDFPLEFAGDRDATDVVLTVADQMSQVNGTLTDAAGKPAIDYFIVLGGDRQPVLDAVFAPGRNRQAWNGRSVFVRRVAGGCVRDFGGDRCCIRAD
jgi:hypothetical protein